MATTSSTAASECNNSALRKATRRVSQLYDRVMAPANLRTTQYAVLVEIDRRGPSALTDLALSLGMDRSTLGHNLRPLEREGFVALEVDPHDRRSRRIGLTAAGKRKLGSARKLWSEAQAQFEQTFGAKEARVLRDALAVLSSEAFAAGFGGMVDEEE
jgi:DNA-binding MarR family transcriptional regulator